MLRSTRAAIETHLRTVAGAIHVAWEDVPFTPPQTGAWLHARMLPGRPEDPTIGDGYRRDVGVYQVDVCTPAGQGPSQAEALCEQLRAAFRRGTALYAGSVRVLIASTPGVASAKADGGCVRRAVSIFYAADTTN